MKEKRIQSIQLNCWKSRSVKGDDVYEIESTFATQALKQNL